MNSPLLTTRAAARLLGVGTTSIKRWADSGLLRCVRTPGGHRRFPRNAVESLLGQQVDQTDQPARHGRDDEWLSELTGETSIGQLVARLQSRHADLGSWCRVAEELASVLTEMGERWRRGQLSVLQEHIASERLARALARTAAQIELPGDAPVALLLVAEGEEHTLGLSLLEVCLREAGYSARWAGRRTPVELIGAHLAQADVALVAVSASAQSGDASALARQAALISEACEAHGVALVLGGRGAWPEMVAHGDRVRDFEHLNQVLAANAGRTATRGMAS